jgi:hypothetical protein
MTKEYRYQQRLRAQGKCPDCQDPVAIYIYCLACRVIRRARVNRYNARRRRQRRSTAGEAA